MSRAGPAAAGSLGDLAVRLGNREAVPFAHLSPLAQQWDPYTSHVCYMLLLPGPTKVDFLFLAEQRKWAPPWRPSVETLAAIDQHFWDWILWLEQKRRRTKTPW